MLEHNNTSLNSRKLIGKLPKRNKDETNLKKKMLYPWTADTIKQDVLYLATSLPRSNCASAMLISTANCVPECNARSTENWKIRISGEIAVFSFLAGFRGFYV